MSNRIFNSDEEPEDSGESAFSTDNPVEDALRHLRLRRMQTETSPWSQEASPPPSEAAIHEELPEAAEEESEEAEEFDFIAAIEELSTEIRRVGREVFKTNRTAERNQEIFNDSLNEIRQLSSVIGQIPAQNAATLNDAKFEARAEICRELLRMADTMEASLAAADELVSRIEEKAARPPKGWAFQFAAARELHASLVESAGAVRQWRDGQSLLAKRLQATLQSAGVRPIEAVGQNFDPAQHRAVSSEVRTDVTPGSVIGEELKGYMLDGRILRYAEVIVSRHE
jgi:hypothetical protein